MKLHCRLEGAADAPVVMLAGSLGSALELWEAQVPALLPRFRVLRYDHPGHGRSPAAPVDGIEGLAGGVLTLLDDLEIERVSWCGVSLGGAVGMRLALDAPERLERLVLACTSARFGPPELWEERAAAVRERGMEAVVGTVRERWFTPGFEDVRRYEAMMCSTDPESYASCCEAIRDWDVREEIRAIAVPTLVVAGRSDPSTPPEHGGLLAERIPGARLIVLDDAAHLANIERADAFNAALLAHLTG